MRASAHASLLAAARKGLRDGTISLPMPFAIVASLLVHAVVLSITFSGAQPTPNIEDRNLEVVLVNARRERAPEQADVLAQANLDGGGPVSEQALTSTPTPVLPSRQDGNAPTAQRRIAAPPPRPVAPDPDEAKLPTVEPTARLRPQPSPRPEPQAAPVRQPPPAVEPEPAAPPPDATELSSEAPQPQRPDETRPEPAAPTVALDAPRPEPPSTTFTAAIKPLTLPEPASAPATDAERVTMALSAPEPARRTPETSSKAPVLSAADQRERRTSAAAPSTVPGTPQRPPPPREAPAPSAPEPAKAPAAPTRSDPEAKPRPAAEQDPAPIPEPPTTQPTPADPAPPSQPAPVARAPERPETPVPPPEPPAAPKVSGQDLMDSIAAVAKLEARIGRQLDEYSKRPRKVHIGTRAREYRFAQYAEDWRQKVERIGTLNYPDDARGRIYGSLVMTVEIRADGTLERVEIDRSSGHDVLDRAAAEIVRMAAPYSPFPPDIRDDTDRVVITRTWTFTNSDQLQTR